MHSRLAEKMRNYLLRAQVYFYYTAKPRSLNPIYRMRLRYQARSKKWLMKKGDVWRYLVAMREKSDSTGCEYGDYMQLYDTIKQLKPRHMLECGSGISSCIMALAAREIHAQTGDKPVCVSMEENPFYFEQVQKIFPNELKPYVQFFLSARAEKMYDGRLGCYYENVPNFPYDFVLVDGPTERCAPGAPKCFNADFANVVMLSEKEVKGLIDQRITTYWAYKHLFPNGAVRYDVVKMLTFLSCSKDHFRADMRLRA